MKCSCLTDIKEKLTENVTKQGVINPQLTEEFLGINLSTGEGIINLVYTVRGDNRPYNTQKGKPLNMVASFCPFCGTSMKAEAKAEVAVEA